MAEPADVVHRLIASNTYLTLGTADADGRPWVSPVFFTPEGDRHFYWVSSPEARHSRNLAGRPEVSLVIFDSQVPLGGAEALYLTATAHEVPDGELAAAAALFNGRLPQEQRFTEAELRPPAAFRLYRATAIEHSLLLRGSDPRNSRGADDREIVHLPPGTGEN